MQSQTQRPPMWSPYLICTTTSEYWSVVTNRQGQTLAHIIRSDRLIVVDIPLFISTSYAPEHVYDEDELVAQHQEVFTRQELPKWLAAGFVLDCCEDISAQCDTILIAARVEAFYSSPADLLRLLHFADAHRHDY